MDTRPKQLPARWRDLQDHGETPTVDEICRDLLVDFGLAVREADLSRERRTCAGTVPYMSPEQLRGKGHRIDGRIDIYSLGVLLYELSTGHRLFVGRASEELIDEILHRDVAKIGRGRR